MTQLKFEYDEDTGAIIADNNGLHIHTSVGDNSAWFILSGEISLDKIAQFLDGNKDCVADWKIFGVREDGLRRMFIKQTQNCNIFELKGFSLLMNLPR